MYISNVRDISRIHYMQHIRLNALVFIVVVVDTTTMYWELLRLLLMMLWRCLLSAVSNVFGVFRDVVIAARFLLSLWSVVVRRLMRALLPRAIILFVDSTTYTHTTTTAPKLPIIITVKPKTAQTTKYQQLMFAIRLCRTESILGRRYTCRAILFRFCYYFAPSIAQRGFSTFLHLFLNTH